MKRVTAACAVSALIVAGTVYISTSADATPTAARIGAAPAVPRGAERIAAPSASQALSLDVTLKPRSAAALSAYADAVSQPGSAEYHHYLSKGQFAQYFGPTQQTIDATESALKSEGLTVDSVSPDGLSISVSTDIAKAGSAFNTSFSGYRLASGHTAYSNNSAPSVPASIAPQVQSVIGLNNLTTFTSSLNPTGHKVTAPAAGTTGAKSKPATAKSSLAAPTVCSNVTTSLADNGWNDGDAYFSPSSLASVYNTAGTLAAGNRGGGIKVGVIELEGVDTAGFTAYENCLGISTSLSVETVDGGDSTAPNGFDGTGIETALDIDTIAGMAPGVSITDYEGPAAATDANVYDIYSKMVTDDSVQVISSSWGSCESGYSGAADLALLTGENTVFQEAATYGQTVVAASGDEGSTACAYLNSDGSLAYPSLAADVNVGDPGSQPYVTGVGGTSIDGLTNTTVTTWNTATDPDISARGASVGGVSEYWPFTSGGYQAGFTGPGYSDAATACASSPVSSFATGDTCRQVPDLSASADPNHGYLAESYYDDGVDKPSEEVYIVGGTSGAAPLVAAIAALADASKDCVANGHVGFLNPALYATATAGTSGVFTDVTTGDNTLPYSGYTGADYSAATGYDLATGLGEPNAAGMIKALCSAVPSAAASYFQPITPVRVLDTRHGTGVPEAKLAKGGVDTLTLAGKDGIADDATAVVVNVTVTDTTGSGFIVAYPTGTHTPTASNVNFVKGQTVPNLVVVPLSSKGQVSFENGGSSSGPLDLIADVSGYFTGTPTSTTSTFNTLTPTRVIDTRHGTGVPEAKLAKGGTDSIDVQGLDGIGAKGTAVAVVANVTVTNTTGAGFITAYGDGGTVPGASNVNFVKGQTVSNLAVVPVGSDGKVDFTNGGSSTGPLDLVVDISGYFTQGTGGLVFHASYPERILDTRSGIGEASAGVIGKGATLGLSLGDPGTPLYQAGAVIANVTVTGPTGAGFIIAYPDGVAVPGVSNVNFTAGETVPNLAFIPNSDGTLDFENSGATTGTTNLILDVSGYFSTS